MKSVSCKASFIVALSHQLYLDPGLDGWVDEESFEECVGTFLKACELIQNVVLLEHIPPWLYDSSYKSEEDRDSELNIYERLCDIIADRCKLACSREL